jgi:hypothetical protein
VSFSKGSWSPRPKKCKDFQRFFLPNFKDFSKTFGSNLQLSKNCECKHHFYPAISPVKSHPTVKCAFSSIFAKILLQSILLARKSYNQFLMLKKLKIFKDFLRFFTQFKDFSKTLKNCKHSNLKTFKDFKDRCEPWFSRWIRMRRLIDAPEKNNVFWKPIRLMFFLARNRTTGKTVWNSIILKQNGSNSTYFHRIVHEAYIVQRFLTNWREKIAHLTVDYTAYILRQYYTINTIVFKSKSWTCSLEREV